MKQVLQSIFVFKMFEMGFYTKAESDGNFDVWYDTEGISVPICQSLSDYWEFFYDNMDIVTRWRFDSAIWQLIQPQEEDNTLSGLLFYDGVAYVKMQDGNMRLMDYVEQLLEKC